MKNNEEKRVFHITCNISRSKRNGKIRKKLHFRFIFKRFQNLKYFLIFDMQFSIFEFKNYCSDYFVHTNLHHFKRPKN
eukprot:UN14581